MEKYRSTGICRLSSRHWKVLISHTKMIDVRIDEGVIHYNGINFFDFQDRSQIKQVINDRILKFKENEK